jgi:hypothetical protein
MDASTSVGLGDRKLLGDLTVGEVLELAKHERGPMGTRKGVQRLPDLEPRVGVLELFVGRKGVHVTGHQPL